QARYVDRSGIGTDLVLIGRTVWAIIAR
ncbi:MAG: hypothetical protein RL260_346, partial [Pseudomonadota bacterium]